LKHTIKLLKDIAFLKQYQLRNGGVIGYPQSQTDSTPSEYIKIGINLVLI